MTPGEAFKRIVAGVRGRAEDVARAKDYILSAQDWQTKRMLNTETLSDHWLSDQVGPLTQEIVVDAASAPDECDRYARAYSLRLAFFQAVWDLLNAGVLLPAGSVVGWTPRLDARHAHGGEGLSLEGISSWFPNQIARPPLRADDPQADLDLFLKGAPSLKLSPGIVEGIRQTLVCFQRGLYLPALVMLGAATEATWIECATALAAKLNDKDLLDATTKQFPIGRTVPLVRKALEQTGGAQLLTVAGVRLGQKLARLTDAEVWTTTLRERRNAVHWGKTTSFIAQHSDAGTLILAAPQHLETIERIRGAC
jgi:hypothetical protein